MRLLAPLFIASLNLFFMLRPLPTAQAVTEVLVVIVGQNTPVTDINSALLRRAFQGDPAEYAPGKRLIAVNHPPATPARISFERAILGMTQDEMARFWVDRRIRDQPPPPKSVPSAELAVRVVKSLPGAITYTSESLVGPGLRILTIDGKLPRQPGYPLP